MKRINDFLRSLDPLVHLVLFVAIAVLGYGYFSLSGRLDDFNSGLTQVKNRLSEVSLFPDTKVSETFLPTASPVASVSPSPRAQTSASVLTPTKKNTTYINLGGTKSVSTNNWEDINSTDVYLDIKNEYGENAYVDWEASVNINSTSAKVYVRLYDVTHNIAVNGSELSSNLLTTTRVSSGRLYLWQGHNQYRVQIRSTDPYLGTFESGRVKIVY